jgi:uncharacterized protein YutE (UPF0331/DUF86 family)
MGEHHLDLLERLLAKMDEYARTVTRETLEHDMDVWLKVSRALELIAQCCVDLAMELVAKRGLGTPETYREAFVRLSQAGVLAAEDAKVLEGWAGLRNVLAHMYTTIDLDRLHAALGEDPAVIRRFGRIAARELLGEKK